MDAKLLQFNGEDANGDAGVITAYDGLSGPTPLIRTELYELWWRQSLFAEKLVIRVGKIIPTYDFNNVTRRFRSRIPASWFRRSPDCSIRQFS